MEKSAAVVSRSRAVDGLMVEALCCARSICDLRERAEESMKQGYWCIGRARYQQGGNGITSAQYDMGMKASLRVDVGSSTDAWKMLFAADDEHREDSPEGTVESQGGDASSPPPSTSASSGAVDALRGLPLECSFTSALRERMVRGGKSSGSAMEEECDSARESRPIRWFGHHVSKPLHEAEKHFARAAQMYVELFHHRWKFLAIEAKYYKALSRVDLDVEE